MRISQKFLNNANEQMHKSLFIPAHRGYMIILHTKFDGKRKSRYRDLDRPQTYRPIYIQPCIIPKMCFFGSRGFDLNQLSVRFVDLIRTRRSQMKN